LPSRANAGTMVVGRWALDDFRSLMNEMVEATRSEPGTQAPRR
jgi:quinol monooxygenase YgiN